MLLQRIAKRRANGLPIQESMRGRLDRHSNGSLSGNLSEYLLALNTREVYYLARAGIEQISRLMTINDQIGGVPIRSAVSQAAKSLPTTGRSAAPNVKSLANAACSDRIRGKFPERARRRGQAMAFMECHQDRFGTALHPS